MTAAEQATEGAADDTATEALVLAVSYSGQCCPGYCVEDIDLHNVDPAIADAVARGATRLVRAKQAEALREAAAISDTRGPLISRMRLRDEVRQSACVGSYSRAKADSYIATVKAIVERIKAEAYERGLMEGYELAAYKPQAARDRAAIERVEALVDEYDRHEGFRRWGIPQAIRAALAGPQAEEGERDE